MVVVIGAISVVSCADKAVSPDATMARLREESIVDFEPTGVTAEPLVELPADKQVEFTNAISRRFVADTEETVAEAGRQIYEAAVADGWLGDAPSDPGSSGVYGTTLAKGEMSLDVTYQTSASFDLMETDEDVLSIDIVISTRSSDPGG